MSNTRYRKNIDTRDVERIKKKYIHTVLCRSPPKTHRRSQNRSWSSSDFSVGVLDFVAVAAAAVVVAVAGYCPDSLIPYRSSIPKIHD